MGHFAFTTLVGYSIHRVRHYRKAFAERRFSHKHALRQIAPRGEDSTHGSGDPLLSMTGDSEIPEGADKSCRRKVRFHSFVKLLPRTSF